MSGGAPATVGAHGRSPGRARLTFVPGVLVPAAGTFALWGVEDLPRAASELGLPVGDPRVLRTIRPTEAGAVEPFDAPARSLPLVAALRTLAALPPGPDWPAWRRPSSSVLAWSVAAKLALEFVAGGRLVPALRPAASLPPEALDGHSAAGDQGVALWRSSVPADGRLTALAAALPLSAYALRSRDDDRAVVAPEELLLAFCDAVADACARAGRRPELDARRRTDRRPWAEMWAHALTASDPLVTGLRVAAEELGEEVEAWSQPLLGRRAVGAARAGFRLEAPPAPPPTGVAVPGAAPAGATSVGANSPGAAASPLALPNDPWQLHILLQSARDPALALPAADVWQARGPVELAAQRIDDAQDLLVRGLAHAARLFEPLDRALSEAEPVAVALTGVEVAALLREGIDALVGAGFGVQVPPELRSAQAQRLRARIRIGQDAAAAPDIATASPLGLRDLLRFRYEIAVGDDTLSDSEFAAVARAGQPLVRWRGQWVLVDHDEVDRLAALRGTSGTLKVTEALAAALSGQQYLDDLGWVDAVPSPDVAAAIDRLRGAGDLATRPRLVGIGGDLRPYQERGIAWLQQLTDLGFGGVLADDMGLGKTVQAIALMTAREQDRPHLVVCPSSVVGNWERELRRWAPNVPVIRHHGADRPNYRAAFRPGHVTVTTYALLRRDVWLLEDIDWDLAIFDEAQQIKNAASKGAKAARSLPARAKIAMTGTPIENRLTELWAIVDLTNPGLLGTQRRFNERFGVPIERWHDDGAARRLRRLTAPFVMRRLKGDPEVAVDLPPKQEITVACSLTREQAALYEAAVEQAFRGGGLGATTFERRGRILALLTALKQICNHPAQYLRDGGRLPGRSGKLARTTEILQEIIASGDSALVFTQFREMGHLLETHLGSELDLPEVPFLHGGVPVGAREAMVERFQQDPDAPPILLVSLRAGGTGLNLTRATEVLHFDRWWNPAVEQQATDRVHRIGQTRPVTAHLLVTAGTIEERIADLLQRKRSLADSVVGAGEAWVTELGDEELRDLVALSRADIEEEDDAA